VPAGAIGPNISIDVGIGAVRAPPAPPAGFIFAKSPVDLSPSGMEFDDDVFLEVPYDDEALRAAGTVSADAWRGMTYDPETGAWSDVAASNDGAAQKITLTLRHFSLYAVLAPAATDLASLKIYPNPFTPSLGHDEVHFANLPPGAALRIFSMAGEKVWEQVDDGQGAIDWDGLNQSGKPVASGIYLAIIDGAGATAKRKIAIER
jgi:hypothetical protein